MDPSQPVNVTGDRRQGEDIHHGGTYLEQQILPTEVSGQNMPPLQVYVNAGMHNANGMAGLESQFHSLGMNEPSDHEHLYDLEDDAGEPIDNDEDEFEEEPVKLFVGQVRIFALSVSRGLYSLTCILRSQPDSLCICKK